MNLSISNRQRHRRVATVGLERLTRWLLAQTGRNLPPDHRWGQLTLILTGDRGIRRINAAVFGRDAVTDVISCRYAPLPGPDASVDADIVLNVQRAQACARRNWPAARELALYLAHGCDHLAGADDADPAGAARMRRRELGWLRRADALGLLDGLLP